MAQFRSHGWKPNELKIYWNAEQLENLCPKQKAENKKTEAKAEVTNETEVDAKAEETKAEVKSDETNETKTEEKQEKSHEVKKETDNENLPPHDPSDIDAVLALREHPVFNRNHECTITYVHKGIEKAVFDVPEDAQLIVLNFAVSFIFQYYF